MEVVNWLKSEHGMGHGHANAVVAYCFCESRVSVGIRNDLHEYQR
jgi:hypothetical protein